MSDVELLEAHIRKLEDVILRFRQATSHEGIINEYLQACIVNALPGGRMDSDVSAKHNREMGQLRRDAWLLVKHREEVAP